MFHQSTLNFITGRFTAPINAEMRVGAVSENVTVTGASPVVDSLKVHTLSAVRRVRALARGRIEQRRLQWY